MNEILSIRNLSFSYNKKSVLLKNINMSFSKGDRVGILGPNGSGKTTLVKLISGVLRKYSGEIFVKGRNLASFSYKELSRLIAVVPQNFNLSIDYKVEDIILMGRYPYSSLFGGFSREDYDILEKVINDMDLQKIRYKNFNRISGGEAQRVVVAKALAQDPEILILDEFAAHLDINHKKNLVDIINNIPKITLIGIYHDVNLCTSMVDKAYFLKEGQIIAHGKIDDMITNNLIEKVYGVKVKIYQSPFGKKKIFI